MGSPGISRGMKKFAVTAIITVNRYASNLLPIYVTSADMNAPSG